MSLRLFLVASLQYVGDVDFSLEVPSRQRTWGEGRTVALYPRTSRTGVTRMGVLRVHPVASCQRACGGLYLLVLEPLVNLSWVHAQMR